MSRQAFNRIAEGLKEALAVASGKADPSTYRVHKVRVAKRDKQ